MEHLGLPRWHSDKEPNRQCRRCKRLGFDPWVEKIPWRRKWQPTPVFLLGKFHGQRSLEGYSPWGRKESNPTEHTRGILKCEGNLWRFTLAKILKLDVVTFVILLKDSWSNDCQIYSKYRSKTKSNVVF